MTNHRKYVRIKENYFRILNKVNRCGALDFYTQHIENTKTAIWRVLLQHICVFQTFSITGTVETPHYIAR